MSEKKVNVLLDKPVTYKGISYPPGVQELPEAAAKAAERKNLGKIVGKTAEAEADFKPLSVEETMKRFQAGDSSDEVFESLKFHQQTIIAGRKTDTDPAASAGKTEEKTSETGKVEIAEVGSGGDEISVFTSSELKQKRKAELVAIAENLRKAGKLSERIVPDEMTNAVIIEKILEAQKN